VLLHVLAHVDADHRALVVEQELGQRLGQLGLADAGGAEEQERADRPVGVLQAGARAAHRARHRADRGVLADDALAQALLELAQLRGSPSSIFSTGMPVHLATTVAMSSSVTSSRRKPPAFSPGRELDRRPRPARARAAGIAP
jgi:hypothetical protein